MTAGRRRGHQGRFDCHHFEDFPMMAPGRGVVFFGAIATSIAATSSDPYGWNIDVLLKTPGQSMQMLSTKDNFCRKLCRSGPICNAR
jgi:hypothetical protein